MRVIVANYRFFIAGGPERYLFNFMAAAERRGVEVIPFSVQNPRNEATKYASYFVKPRADALMYGDTRHTPRNLYGMARATLWNTDAARRLRRLIRDTKPDALYILHEINHLSPSIIHTAKQEGVRVVHRISDFFMFCPKYDFLCGEEICEACLHGKYHKALQQRCVKGSRAGTLLRVAAMRLYQLLGVFQEVDQFVVPSAFTKGKLIEGGIPEDQILHIPTFINCEETAPCYTHEKYFLFLGRLAVQKGPIYAIQAMDFLRDSDYVLKLTGTLTDTEEDQELRACIQTLQLEHKVVFTGFQSGESLEVLINSAACVVCPAVWYENMPNAVLEAYAHGKPVVASRLGSLVDLVEDGRTGFLFTPKNIWELAECLQTFTLDETLSARLGRNARRKCELEFCEELHMEKVLDCLLKGGSENRAWRTNCSEHTSLVDTGRRM